MFCGELSNHYSQDLYEETTETETGLEVHKGLVHK